MIDSTLIQPIESLQPDDLTQSSEPLDQAENSYLRFQIGADLIALLPMAQVQEVLALPATRLTPMPNMPPSVSGLMNRRSRVLWVIDLGRLLGIVNASLNHHEHNLIIVRTGAIAFALSVQKIKGIARIPSSSIQMITDQVSSLVQAHSQTCLIEKSKTTPILDLDRIASSSFLQN
jgi:positive phototaxis protein PixI